VRGVCALAADGSRLHALVQPLTRCSTPCPAATTHHARPAAVCITCVRITRVHAQGVVSDWRIIAAWPLLMLIDLLLKTPPVARALFDNLAKPETITKVGQHLHCMCLLVRGGSLEHCLRFARCAFGGVLEVNAQTERA
jgi:hypothetical protein